MFIQFVPIWASDIDVSLSGLVFGCTLIFTLLLIPSGIGGVAERFYHYACARLGWVDPMRSRRATGDAMEAAEVLQHKFSKPSG